MNDLSEIKECLDSIIINCVKSTQFEESKATNSSELHLQNSQQRRPAAALQEYVEDSDSSKSPGSAKFSGFSENEPKEYASSFSISNLYGRKTRLTHELVEKLPSKKRKLTTLEKSLMDWERFKNEEDLNEELTLHNKGKDGYLSKQAFLQRCDVRTFEQERVIRLSNRKQ